MFGPRRIEPYSVTTVAFSIFMEFVKDIGFEMPFCDLEDDVEW
jgi:hypothetical protein